jgi:hypothetical protein
MAVTPDSSSRKRLAIFRIGIGKTARLTALAPRTSARDGRAAFPRAKAQPEPAGARANRERQDGAEGSVDGQHHGEEHQTTLARGNWPDHHADDQIEQPEQESQGESVPATYGKGVDGLGDTSDDEDLGKRTLQDVIQITICPSVCPWRAQAEPPPHRGGWLHRRWASEKLSNGIVRQVHAGTPRKAHTSPNARDTDDREPAGGADRLRTLCSTSLNFGHVAEWGDTPGGGRQGH